VSGPPPLTFLTWNLAMLARSAEAPPGWSQEHTEARIRELVLELSPDLVLLQELPGLVPYVETHDMIRANPRSHSGNLAILVGHDLLDEQPAHAVVEGCALLVTFPERDLTVANVHLAPGRGGAGLRLAQLEAVIQAAPTIDVAVIGDTNTRTGEEAGIGSLGLAGERPPSATWDGRRNPFNGPAGDFVAYFTRAFASDDVLIVDQTVHPGRVTIDGTTFHLSDHFGLSGTIVTRSS